MGSEIIDNMPGSIAISLNLESLLKLSNTLNASTDLNYILNSVLLSLMGKLRMIRAGVYQPSSDDLSFFTVTNHKGKIKHNSFRINDTILQHLLTSKNQTTSPNSEICTTESLANDAIDVDYNKCCIPELQENGYEYAFSVVANDKIYAIICLGNRINSTPLHTEEVQYAELMCRIAASALSNAESIINLKQTTTELIKQNQVLSSIFEMSRDFSTLLSREQIIRILSYRLMGQLMVSKFSVYLLDESGNYLPVINRFDLQLSKASLDEVFAIDNCTLLKHHNFSHSAYQEINTLKAKAFIPMIVQSKKKGFLCVGKKMNADDFTDENLKFMEALANRAMSAIENERLFREEVEKKKLESELNYALEIQQNLLPLDTPELSTEYSIAGESLPSRMVGGDYFDFIPISQGQLLIAIADVSGKGMPAALLMANVQAALRALAPLSLTLRDLVLRINSIVFKNTSPDKFVTFFVGILDSESHSFNYINAGHNPPVIIRNDDSQELLTAGGLILGIFDEGIEYQNDTIQIFPGNILCLYTDGITESPAPNGEEYGESRLYSCLSANKGNDARDILKEIISEVALHSDSDNRYDDLTAVVVKRNL